MSVTITSLGARSFTVAVTALADTAGAIIFWPTYSNAIAPPNQAGAVPTSCAALFDPTSRSRSTGSILVTVHTVTGVTPNTLSVSIVNGGTSDVNDFAVAISNAGGAPATFSVNVSMGHTAVA